MKKGLLLMTALLLVSGASMAQKVVNIGGKAIIDNRAMPAKAITSEKKARTTDATDDTLGTNDLTNIASAETNKTVSHYFEVMKIDYNKGAAMNWLEAIQYCANYDSKDDDKTWRLPTQRELMLIWTLHESLKKKVVDFVSFTTSIYWSATYLRASDSWYVVFSDGRARANCDLKLFDHTVRCVRDLTPPLAK